MDNLILKDIVNSIQTREYVLPVIQRDFVWKPEKICLLFDSILRGYSIGLFLFWELNDERRRTYETYAFPENYADGGKQEHLNLPLPPLSKYAILDGQQRLTSIYLALKGTYAYAKGSDRDLVKRKFYINLLHTMDTEDVDDNIKFEFDFFANNELKNDENHYWYLVNNVLTDSRWNEQNAAEQIYEDICNKDYLDINTEEALIEYKEDVIERLQRLHKYICCEKFVQVFCIGQEVCENEVLDIFVRVNSQGKQLSRTDFIFSRIVSVWRDARQMMDDFQKKKKIEDFLIFDKDLIMRICLAVVNKSNVSRLTTDKFNAKTIKSIKENWQIISACIEDTVDILIRLGYSAKTITSTNALIPIICFLYKGGMWKDGGKELEDLNDIRKYLSIIALRHIFSGQTLGKLNKILNALCDESSRLRPFERVLAMPDFKVDETHIEEALLTVKGHDAFAILSLLYKDKNYKDNSYDQDHMHPWAMISKKSTYKKHGVSEDKMSEWKKKADTLPNLQILEASENKHKSGTLLDEWVKDTYKDENERNNYFSGTYLNSDIPLEFEKFEEFYEKRKELLKNALMAKLDIDKCQQKGVNK